MMQKLQQHKMQKLASEIKETLRLIDNEVLWIWLARPLFLVLCHIFPFPAAAAREKQRLT